MSAWQYVSSALVSVVATAATYLVLHSAVGPGATAPLIDVPQVTGLTPDQARAIAEPTGLSLVIDGQREPDSDKTAAGTLFDQRPLNGSRLRRGSEIHAILALPVTKVAVPPLGGQLLSVAQKTLADLGLKPGVVSELPSPTVPPGAVILSDPPAGSQVHRGDSIALQVAKASEQVQVPNLRGRSVGSARQALEQLGLSLGDVSKGSDDNAADGAILRQSPSAGTPAAKGQKVNVVVNDG
jgi:serine/threonine-protein kinase